MVVVLALWATLLYGLWLTVRVAWWLTRMVAGLAVWILVASATAAAWAVHRWTGRRNGYEY